MVSVVVEENNDAVKIVNNTSETMKMLLVNTMNNTGAYLGVMRVLSCENETLKIQLNYWSCVV